MFEEDKKIRDGFNEARDKEIKTLEQKVIEKFDQEEKALQDTEKRLLTLIEDKTAMVRSDIAREAAIRTENIEYLKSCLEGDIPKLQDAVKTETNEREEAANANLKKVNEEMQKLQETVALSKKNREESEEALLEMLKDMVGRIKGEIENEKKER